MDGPRQANVSVAGAQGPISPERERRQPSDTAAAFDASNTKGRASFSTTGCSTTGASNVDHFSPECK